MIKYEEKQGSDYRKGQVMVTSGRKETSVIRKRHMGHFWGASDILFLDLDNGVFSHSLIREAEPLWVRERNLLQKLDHR